LDADPINDRLAEYYEGNKEHYAIDKGQGKALEHALGLELIEFAQVKRYCDIASAASPIRHTLVKYFPNVELWVQDLSYVTNMSSRRIGGGAQDMTLIPDGYFDAMTLHNSFEHFAWNADSEFIAEVDRVLSPIGACVIVPLYLAASHRIFFDPIVVSARVVDSYDKEAELVPVRAFGQEHARFYSAATLYQRLLAGAPLGLTVTILELVGGSSISPLMYPEFALVLHREKSVFKYS